MMIINESVKPAFYDWLYVIALKALLIDRSSWAIINEQYAVKTELLNDGFAANPEIAIMLVNSAGTNVYEHRFTILKTNIVNGTSALYKIMQDANFKQKAAYIFSPEPTNPNSLYRHCYIPIHRKSVDKQLDESIKKAYKNAIIELNSVITRGNFVETEKRYVLK